MVFISFVGEKKIGLVREGEWGQNLLISMALNGLANNSSDFKTPMLFISTLIPKDELLGGQEGAMGK